MYIIVYIYIYVYITNKNHGCWGYKPPSQPTISPIKNKTTGARPRKAGGLQHAGRLRRRGQQRRATSLTRGAALRGFCGGRSNKSHGRMWWDNTGIIEWDFGMGWYDEIIWWDYMKGIQWLPDWLSNGMIYCGDVMQLYDGIMYIDYIMGWYDKINGIIMVQ